MDDKTDYKKLYYALFNDVTDALCDAESVVARLKKIQEDAEERFLDEGE